MRRNQPDGRWYKCKPCASRFGKRYKLKRRYGIDEVTYARLLHEQGGLCAICRAEPGARRLHVDHDHDTGAIRGLLCFKCNQAIGYMDDSMTRLANAVMYLARVTGVSVPMTSAARKERRDGYGVT